LYAIDGAPGQVRFLSRTRHILATNGSALFHTPDGRTIVRHDVASDEESVIATGVDLTASGARVPAWANDAWLYVGDRGRVVRVGVNGGASEIVWDDGGGSVGAITGDGCATYFAALPKGSAMPALYGFTP